MSKIIIIGGGASGLVASIFASRNNNDVTLLERNSNCGKKLLITGNGKCNYWNSDLNISHYNSSNINLVNDIINKNNIEKVLNFFDEIGIIPNIKNGYYYPYSNQAISIREALLLEAELSGVNIINNCLVNDIIKEEKFILKTNIKDFECDKVILSTGSKACPKTGSDGIGYDILRNLNHNIIEPLPALVQLIGDEKYFKDWAGIRCEVLVKLIENNNCIKEEKGEIQLTDYGVSGICIMQLSGLVAKGLYEGKNEKIKINFIPNINDFISWMNLRDKKIKNRNITQLLDGLFNYKLVNLFMKLSNIDKNKKWNELNNNEKNKINNLLTSFELSIIKTNSFDNAQVCSGGIKLSEININTMESLIIKNLYITGELLDVNGDCGGYNLAFAFITGYLAGGNIID